MALVSRINGIRVIEINSKKNLEDRSDVKVWDSVEKRSGIGSKGDVEGIKSIEAIKSDEDLEVWVVINSKSTINNKGSKMGWNGISENVLLK